MAWFLVRVTGDGVVKLGAVVPRQMLCAPTAIVAKTIWMNIAVHRLSVKQSVHSTATVERFVPALTLQLHDGRELLEIPPVCRRLFILQLLVNFFLL